MELASMLAGEPFSDHPQCVCPVIGSFLRSYNDSIDDARRQDLYEYAAAVVGSRSSESVQRLRAQRLLAWIGRLQTRRWTRLLVPARIRALAPKPLDDMLGPHAVRAIGTHTDRTHDEALAMIDELLAVGTHEATLALTPARGKSAKPAPARSPGR
jgi:hypothetical protein